MSIELLHPYFLLLLVVSPLVWFWPRGARRGAARVLRALVLALLVLALAEPVLVMREESTCQVLVIDRSGSVDAAARARTVELAREWRQQVSGPDRAAVVLFGGDESAAIPGLEGLRVTHLGDGAGGSPLGAALAAALRQIPRDSAGGVTLLTDGLGTDRRWGPVVQQFVERGIPLKVVDLDRPDLELRAVGVSAPPRLHVGQTAGLLAHVAGEGRELVARVRDHTGRELARSEPFACAGRADVHLEFEPDRAGVLDVVIEVAPAGAPVPVPARQSFRAAFAIQPPLRLLYLGGRMEAGAARLAELLGRAFHVTDGEGLVLDDRTDLRAFDVVMIDDRPAAELPAAFQGHLAHAVREEGLGLLFAGGRASFGAGGYDDTPVADLLPVDIVQHAEKQDPSTALALIIDTSGSMQGERIELAKQIARLAIRRLKAHDRVGIVEFYGNKHWALPLQSAANKIAIERAIGRMQATGGTVLYPAIEEAYYGLKNVSTRFKHILLITDAGVEDADYAALVRSVAKDNVHLSTVLVGAQAHSKSLLDMANWGNGRFYGASDRFALPEIMLKQATTTNLPAYKNGSFPLVARGGPTWWTEPDHGGLPPLAGYVETQARPGAEVLLDVAEAGHPVLATWQNGVGRVTAMMTEPLAEGTRRWREWPGYGRWLARIATRTAAEQTPFRFTLERRGRELLLAARRAGTARDLEPRATFARDGAGEEAVAFERVAPDRFEARITSRPDVVATVKAKAVDAAGRPAGPETLLVSAARADVAPELQVDPVDALDLAALAGFTGGTIQAIGAGPLGALPRPPAGHVARVAELGAWAALLALLVYLAEILWRRWPGSAPDLSASSRP